MWVVWTVCGTAFYWFSSGAMSYAAVTVWLASMAIASDLVLWALEE